MEIEKRGNFGGLKINRLRESLLATAYCTKFYRIDRIRFSSLYI
jgi:hypothetical protein